MKKLFLSALLLAALCGCTCKAPQSGGRIRINVDMSVSADNRAALMENLLALAEASRAEQGCICYEIYENSRDSSRVMIIETWESAEALAAHQQTEHFLQRAPLNGKLSSSSELSQFTF